LISESFQKINNKRVSQPISKNSGSILLNFLFFSAELRIPTIIYTSSAKDTKINLFYFWKKKNNIILFN